MDNKLSACLVLRQQELFTFQIISSNLKIEQSSVQVKENSETTKINMDALNVSCVAPLPCRPKLRQSKVLLILQVSSFNFSSYMLF